MASIGRLPQLSPGRDNFEDGFRNEVGRAKVGNNLISAITFQEPTGVAVREAVERLGIRDLLNPFCGWSRFAPCRTRVWPATFCRATLVPPAPSVVSPVARELNVCDKISDLRSQEGCRAMSMDSYHIWLKEIREKLAAAVTEAAPLVEQGKFDEAEKLVRAVESDIYGTVALGGMFSSALERVVRSPHPDRVLAQALYERALRWRSAWPGVHTQEEADAERAHAEEVRQELTALLQSLPEV